MVVADEDVAKLRPAAPSFTWIYDITERQKLMAQERERLQQRQQALDGELNQVREREQLMQQEQARLQEQLKMTGCGSSTRGGGKLIP